MKTRKDKAYSYEHTKQRALERYGIELTPQIYEEWNALCSYDNRIQIDDSNNQATYIIKWQGREITVVQTTSGNSGTKLYIKTVLPEGTKLVYATSEKINGKWRTYERNNTWS
jgi:hypothetical protein